MVLLFVMGFENVLHSLNSLQHGDPEVAVSLRVRSEVFPAAAAIQVSSCFGHPPCRDQKSLFLWLRPFFTRALGFDHILLTDVAPTLALLEDPRRLERSPVARHGEKASACWAVVLRSDTDQP